jgi:catalase-peroxidase
MDDAAKTQAIESCPVLHGRAGRSNRDWWPEALSLQALRQPSPRSDPMGEAFDYAAESRASIWTP